MPKFPRDLSSLEPDDDAIEAFLAGQAALTRRQMLCVLGAAGVASRSTSPRRRPKTKVTARAAAVTGWRVPTAGSQILAINAALLPGGRVLYWGGSQFIAGGSSNPAYAQNVDSTRIWSATDESVISTPSPARSNRIGGVTDIFCAGSAYLAGDRLLVAGGWIAGNGRPAGPRDVSIFDRNAATTNKFIAVSDMSSQRGRSEGGGRWYPTLITLPDGKVAMFLGLPLPNDTRSHNVMVEVYNPATNQWVDRGDAPMSPFDVEWSYPRGHLLPNGKIFFSTPIGGHARTWDPGSGAWAEMPAPPVRRPQMSRRGDEALTYWRTLGDGLKFKEPGAAPRVLVGDGNGPASLRSDPTAVQTSSGVLDCFWKGADNNLWHVFSLNNGASWIGPESLGCGPLGGPPKAVGQSSGVVDVFWRGTDNRLWSAFYVPNEGWRGPRLLGAFGSGEMRSDPSPVTTDLGTVDVFWKGADANLWHAFTYRNTPWVGPESLGCGPLNGAPYAAGQPNGIVDVFWRGLENGLWSAFYVPNEGWRGPRRMGGYGGGELASDPSPVISSNRTVDVFWRGADHNLWHAFSFNAGPWSNQEPFTNGASPMGAGPTACGRPNGNIDVTWRGQENTVWTCKYTPGTGWQQTTNLTQDELTGDNEFQNFFRLATSVLLPLRSSEGYRARVLILGGKQPMVIDHSAADPKWEPTAPRAIGTPRYNCSAVLLPDGKVCVVGGSAMPTGYGDRPTDQPVLHAEIYDPAANSWSLGAQASVPRYYHSVGLALSDGRVWTAGSNLHCKAADIGTANDTRERRIEIYTPPNLGGTRPTISSAPSTFNPGTGSLSIGTPQAASVQRASLVRCGSTTHGFDADQRCILLEVASRGTSSVSVPLPPSRAIAPPGPYFLYLIGQDGTPSTGWPIQVV